MGSLNRLAPWFDMVNALLYHIASGHAFFSGIALIHLAALMSLRVPGHWRAFVRTVSACAGLLLIAVSATPAPGWFYVVAATVSLAWIVLEGVPRRISARTKLGIRLAVLTTWWLGVAMELPYHVVPAVDGDFDPPVHVVGDSISAGMGGESETWPHILTRRHNVPVRNLSRSGANVATSLGQARQVSGSTALVIVEIGGNDVLGNTSPAVFERGLDELLVLLQGERRTIVLLELPLPPLANQYGSAQRRAAARHGVLLVPKRVLLGALTTQGATLDTIHLSRAGHELLAEAVWRVIRGSFRPRS